MSPAPRPLLAAIVLAAATAAAVPVAMEPSRAVPVVLVAATALALVLLGPTPNVRTLAALGGTLLCVTMAQVAAPAAGGAWVVLPLAAAHVGLSPGWALALALPLAAADLAVLPHGTRPSPLDGAALALSGGWAAYATALLAAAGLAHLATRKLRRTLAAAHGRRDADVGALDQVYRTLVDEGRNHIAGAGISEQELAVATAVGPGRVLVARIPGAPLSTLTAGWILRAWALAGCHEPARLLQRAAEELDEILDGRRPVWVGIWHRTRRTILWSDGTGPKTETTASTLVVGRHGPFGEPCHPEIRGLPAPTGPPPDPAERVRPSLVPAAALAAGLTLAAFGSHAALGPLLIGCSGLAAGLGARVRRAQQVARARVQAALDDRLELRAELARLHGATLLPEVSAGSVRLQAHRLRGEQLDATFVDLFAGGDGFLWVVAGELAGRGVLDRFVATLVAVLARRRIAEGVRWPELFERVREDVAPLTQAWFGGPPRFVLGTVAVDGRSGKVAASGTLAHLVVAGPDGVTITSSARLDEEVEVFSSPATVRPGPGEIAPPLRPAAAARRMQAILADLPRGKRPSLAALFAQVFDGTNAPTSGTLLCISRRSLPAQPAAA